MIKRYDPRHILQAIGLAVLEGQPLSSFINVNKSLGMATISNTALDTIIAKWRSKDLNIIQVHPSAPTVSYVRVIVKERKS